MAVRMALALVVAVPLLATRARADEGDREAWREALGSLEGRIVQYGTLIDGREARVLARVQSVVPSEEGGFRLLGIRTEEAPGVEGGRLCHEEELDGDAFSLRVLQRDALVGFGSTLPSGLRARLGLPADAAPIQAPDEDQVAELERCARRAREAPLRSVTIQLLRSPPQAVGRAPEPPQPFAVEYGFDGTVHSVQEEPGEQLSEAGFTVVMRPGFRVEDLRVENSNVTVMHCSDEGGWTTLDFKVGTTPWLALKRTANQFRVGAVRVAPFPKHTKAELDAANTQGFPDCSPVLGARRYRILHKGRTLKTIVVTPALGC